MLPLANRRILITRAKGQASALATQLESLGATPILIPTIEIAPPKSFIGLDAAISQLRHFDWVIFTSPNAVKVFAERSQRNQRRVAAIGPATAKAVLNYLGRRADLIPPVFVAESLAESLVPEAPGSNMLLVRAEVGRDTLRDTLSRAGAKITIAVAYRNVIPKGSIIELRELFATAPPDAITFTSASTVENFVALYDAALANIPTNTVLASIGPITSKAMRDLGLEPTIEASEATIPALVAALSTTASSFWRSQNLRSGR